MPVPPNTTAATAIALTPGTVTQRVDDGGVTYDVWYTYANTSGADQVISLWHTGDLGGGGYRPTSTVWKDPDSDALINNQYPNGSATLPIPAGWTYWVEIRHDPGDPSPATLTLGFQVAADAPAEAGQVFIPGASMFPWMLDAGLTGLHAGIVDADTGTITGFVPQFPVGEAGDVFPTTGRILMVDEAGSLSGFPPPNPTFGYWVYRYSPAFAILAPPIAVESNQLPPLARTHVPSERIYLVGLNSGGAAHYLSVDANGTASASTPISGAALGGSVKSLAVNHAATILYLGVGVPSSAVRRWDLVGLAFLIDLAPAVATYTVTDLLVLADDSVVACYFKSGTPRDVFVRRYSAAGALIQTYLFALTAPLTAVDPRIGYAADPGAFWFFAHLTTGESDLRKVRVSDGVALVTSLTPDVQQSDDEQATPPVPYTSDSCPILELRVDEEPGGGTTPPPAYTLDERHIRRLRRAPHVNHEHKRVFFRSFELDLERGQGLATGQGEDPIITLRLSRDGGQTWGEPMPLHAGRLGAYTQRVIARRLGVARDTVFEVTVSDPVAWSLVGAWLDLEPGTH